MTIDREAPVRYLQTAFHPQDWVAVLLKSHDTGGTAQRVGPRSLIAHPRFQAWLRAQSVRRFSVYVSVNAIRPQRKARTRDAIGDIRHVFLDADREGAQVLAAIGARRDLPPPSYVLHSSPNRLHVLWRVSGFTRETVETLQKQLARELQTDKAASSCAQMTRLPGFFNHKYPTGADGGGPVWRHHARVRALRFPRHPSCQRADRACVGGGAPTRDGPRRPRARTALCRSDTAGGGRAPWRYRHVSRLLSPGARIRPQ